MISMEIRELLNINRYKSDLQYLNNDFTIDWNKVILLLSDFGKFYLSF